MYVCIYINICIYVYIYIYIYILFMLFVICYIIGYYIICQGPSYDQFVCTSLKTFAATGGPLTVKRFGSVRAAICLARRADVGSGALSRLVLRI